ncbi:hypothetical protein [Castellaniella defragrans]|uniref:hypothetical protein n=1 Tax=Castellaniella defragrans TaxID=75697 RepID=UPI001F56BCBC|nr:hypothetical protein [Castellaniella defragrans]
MSGEQPLDRVDAGMEGDRHESAADAGQGRPAQHGGRAVGPQVQVRPFHDASLTLRVVPPRGSSRLERPGALKA